MIFLTQKKSILSKFQWKRKLRKNNNNKIKKVFDFKLVKSKVHENIIFSSRNRLKKMTFVYFFIFTVNITLIQFFYFLKFSTWKKDYSWSNFWAGRKIAPIVKFESWENHSYTKHGLGVPGPCSTTFWWGNNIQGV